MICIPLNRNIESHFSSVPTARIERSIMDMSRSHKTSFNAGRLIPFDVQEILPGDNKRIAVSKVLRMQTPVTPIMDDLYCDTYYFFVPNRLTWDHWEEFCGENKSGAWAPDKTFEIPTISCPRTSPAGTMPEVYVPFSSGTIADYMGFPVKQTYTDPDTGEKTDIAPVWKNSDDFAPMALPFRAYALICNHFFRDENLSDPLLVPTDSADQIGSNGDDGINDVANGGMPYRVSKYHDYFTSCLPSAQKGTPVGVPLTGSAPVIPSDVIPGTLVHTAQVKRFFPLNSKAAATNQVPIMPLYWSYLAGDSKPNPKWTPTSTDGNPNSIVTTVQAPQETSNYKRVFSEGYDGSGVYFSQMYRGANDSAANISGSTSGNTAGNAIPVNLRADMDFTSADVSFPINQFRLAYAYQEYLEALARGGSRYGEMINSIFGVINPDSRLQHPEYLGGARIPIVINEVLNTSQDTENPLGDTGAQSATADVQQLFSKGFTEHGFLIGVCCVRYNHTYGQGFERFWMRKKFTDFYNPKFANLGEMPVYKYQLFCDSDARMLTRQQLTNLPPVFGYQEAWAEYRYGIDRVSGEMRPGVPGSLAYWHLADFYKESPNLSDDWIRENGDTVDRVLAVTSKVSNQFFADFYIQDICTRCMPMYSIPALVPRF